MEDAVARPAAIAGAPGTGPYAVGAYAEGLRSQLRGFARVQLFGEVCGLRTARSRVYFELRDARGALPCAMWRTDLDGLDLPGGGLAEGARVVVAGGCDFYTGSASASPAFSFAVTTLRLAGEGDLLAQVERLRRTLADEGLFAPQKALPRPSLPRVIGVVTGESGKARDDVLAGLRRRGWAGTVVWAFAPVQDRRAAPAIARALTGLAARPEVEVVVVARGGGSVADLLAFSDETLCRTVALLRVPVISSVGHHTDRPLIDDVAAVACSTPTHAAEVAVPLDCAAERARLRATSERLVMLSRRAVADRGRSLARLARAPVEHVARERARLHRIAGDLRAAPGRRIVSERDGLARAAAGLARLGVRRGDALHLRALVASLDAHDPQRTLERGFVRVEDPAGDAVTSLVEASGAAELRLRFADGALAVRPLPGEPA